MSEEAPPIIHRIPIREIKIVNRRRKVIGNIANMKFSMDQRGLKQPIGVNKVKNGYELIFGLRRLTAATELGWTSINCLLEDDIPELERAELEWIENNDRKDMLWWEKVESLAELFELKKTAHKGDRPSRFSRAHYTQRDLSREMESLSEAQISQDLDLARAMQDNPGIREASSRREALRLLRRHKTGTPIDGEPLLIKYKERFLLGAMAEALERTPDSSVALVITDLTGLAFTNSDIQQIYDKLSAVGQGFIFIDMDHQIDLFSGFLDSKIHYQRNPYIWHVKGSDSYKTYIWFGKASGAKPPSGIKLHTTFPMEKAPLHELEKPKSLLFRLITNSTQQNQTVFDPRSFSLNLTRVCVEQNRFPISYCPERVLHEQCLLREEMHQKALRKLGDRSC